MIFASWNIRGVNDPLKQREVRSLVFGNNVSLLGLNETRVHKDNSFNIAESMLRGWRYIFNYNQHANGRIWVLWNPSIVEVTEIFSTDQIIHVEVRIIQKQLSFLASFIYGLHSRR